MRGYFSLERGRYIYAGYVICCSISVSRTVQPIIGSLLPPVDQSSSHRSLAVTNPLFILKTFLSTREAQIAQHNDGADSRIFSPILKDSLTLQSKMVQKCHFLLLKPYQSTSVWEKIHVISSRSSNKPQQTPKYSVFPFCITFFFHLINFEP